jgi:hypothetical protein
MTLVRSILIALAVLVPTTWTVALADEAPKKEEKKKDDKKKDDKKKDDKKDDKK